MKVCQYPQAMGESGIKRVLDAYHKYLPDYGIEWVEPELAEVKLIHAGDMECQPEDVVVAACHGLYWTADYHAPHFEYRANQKVISSLRYAREITVPSAWVRENIQRDMRRTAHVVPHGIEAEQWRNEGDGGYVLWNKNRPQDVCSPKAVNWLAERLPHQKFTSTFALTPQDNITVCGVLPHDQMKELIQRCGIYLVTSKETFCIGALEAMAASKPVLYYAYGSVPDLVPHGIAGYGAEPGNQEDLLAGLEYCLRYQKVLGANGRELVKQYTWDRACRQMAGILESALKPKPETVTIVIPCYNKERTVRRAIASALQQTRMAQVIVVDDGSTDNSWAEIMEDEACLYPVKTENLGVAHARNVGWQMATSEYVVFLDADDTIDPTFVETLLPVIVHDPTLGAVYCGIRNIYPDGRSDISLWPGEWDYSAQLRGKNQIPTCAMIRRLTLEALGGFREAYAQGKKCGFEDADFYLRMGAYGWRAERVTNKPLFIYSIGSGEISGAGKQAIGQMQHDEIEYYRQNYPWYTDQQHPLASYAPVEMMSHPVRQYDEPVVSVIIHGDDEDLVRASVDSLEAQTFRKWEAVTDIDLTGYPYLRRTSRTKLTLDLQAGDRLERSFLEQVLGLWSDTRWNVVVKDGLRWVALQGNGNVYCLLSGPLFHVGPGSVEVACPSCGQQRTVRASSGNVRVNSTVSTALNDDDYQWVKWQGDEGVVVGPQTKTRYGVKKLGEKMLAHKTDVLAWGTQVGPVIVTVPTTTIVPPPAPKKLKGS